MTAPGGPVVSVVIPVRNEARFIGGCLDDVSAQDYPAHLVEILVVDGGSRDGTRDIVASLGRLDRRISLLDNPRGSAPAGLNVGIRATRGEVIARVDARAVLEPDYLSTGVRLLQETGADNVGGPRTAVAATFRGRLLGLVLESRFGMGGAARHYRERELRAVDTVYLGIYPRRTLEAIGLYEEELVRDQDDELNFRLRARGGRILISPALRTGYLTLPSLRRFVGQNFLYGLWKVRVFQKHPGMMSARHFVPPLFALGLVAGVPLALASRAAALALGVAMSAYGVGAVGASVALSRRVGWRYAPALPPTFFLLHLAWGLGFLAGLLRFLPRWAMSEPPPPALARLGLEEARP